MKVRGFQVAPAELEGCILDHCDVTGGLIRLCFAATKPLTSSRLPPPHQMHASSEYQMTSVSASSQLSRPFLSLRSQGGEVPMAFVVPTHEANQRMKDDPKLAENIKASIAQVCF